MSYIVDLLLNQIFTQPFLLLAIVVFIGYMAMKQTVSKALIELSRHLSELLLWESDPARCPRTSDIC